MGLYNARDYSPGIPNDQPGFGQQPRKPYNPMEDDQTFGLGYDPNVEPPDQSQPNNGNYPSALGQLPSTTPPAPGTQPQTPGAPPKPLNPWQQAANSYLQGGLPALLQQIISKRWGAQGQMAPTDARTPPFIAPQRTP